jgi:coenzyme Q-binding protein COQ10
MPTHAEQRVLPYTPEQLFELVADVERYPEFLPWCRASRVTSREGDVIHADLVIGFKLFRERFTSRVTLDRPGRIDVKYIKGPMRRLDNHWRFIAQDGGGTMIDFYVDFEFRSAILQMTIGALFNEAAKRMVSAFEKRARKLYGSPSSPSK